MNTRTDEPLDRFESRLLGELREVVGERAGENRRPEPAAAPGRHPRRWVLAGAAAAAAVGLVAWNAVGQASPAYAVDTDADGDVTITIHRLEDAAGLEAALAEHGIAADVTYLPDGQTCADGRFTAADIGSYPMEQGVGTDGQWLTVPAGALADGQTLVLVNTEFPDGGIGGTADIADGPIGECVPVPLTVPDTGDGADGHGGSSDEAVVVETD